MRIKLGTLKKDVTAYGNKYWIQIEDTKGCDNSDLEGFLDKKITVVIDSQKAIDYLISDFVEEVL
ncbi:hypothetical protein UFOVP610_43 [uncultured Caudovirales phage]|uniref:Uncharacterized protein n=1 Tax=uncultured Caudovirales phage TaxID=2100421 RepID=A0A6J5N6S5_9CAUD|nr:hypothetical protein UFOVP610_43 [uncultured Caudovirales phage]